MPWPQQRPPRLRPAGSSVPCGKLPLPRRLNNNVATLFRRPLLSNESSALRKCTTAVALLTLHVPLPLSCSSPPTCWGRGWERGSGASDKAGICREWTAPPPPPPPPPGARGGGGGGGGGGHGRGRPP